MSKLIDLTDRELCGLYESYWDLVEVRQDYSTKDYMQYEAIQEELWRRRISVDVSISFQTEDGEEIKPAPHIDFD